MTLRILVSEGRATPLDEVMPARGMRDIQFDNLNDLPPPIPERIAVLRIAPMGDIIDGVGVRIDEDTFIVQECVYE